MKKFELGRLMCTVILGTSFLTGSAYAEENLSEFVLDGINVTALGYEKNNLDTPADTVIYTGEQLKETGAAICSGSFFGRRLIARTVTARTGIIQR